MTRRLAASLAILSLLVSTTAVVPAATLAASVAESNTYLEAVDADSARVVHDVAATSVGGLPIDYAIVGTPERVTATGRAAIRDSL